ncbi:MAG: SH3 domain-containing protein [Anaerolineae bacterium]|nr:SH3 domain-containing protein [Anaerolineae bacterium]
MFNLRTLRSLMFVGLLMLPYVRTDHAWGSELVASLENLGGSVAVKRFDSESWTGVNQESIVGVGDTIRTDATGHARITFFANGVETELLPASALRIDAFNGSAAQYELSITVIIGQTTQRVTKLLDSGSRYAVNSTGLELAVRGTVFAVRVEPSGRSATIVQNGLVKAANAGRSGSAANADIPAGYGVRAEAGKGLSEVVQARSFTELDAALDGCPAAITITDDAQLNVRSGPSQNFPRVGGLDNVHQLQVVGVTATTGWYRIPYRGGFAWVNPPALRTDRGCVGLRKFPDNWGPEDTSRYTGPDPNTNPPATPQATSTP